MLGRAPVPVRSGTEPAPVPVLPMGSDAAVVAVVAGPVELEGL